MAAPNLGRVTLNRRQLVLGFGAVALLAGCSASTPTEKPIDVMGDTRQSGDPLWVPSFEVWLVAATPGDAKSDLLAVSGLCPQYDRRVGWCTNLDVFICPLCRTLFDRVGTKYRGSGPAAHGLDRFTVNVSANGDVEVDRSQRTVGGSRQLEPQFFNAVSNECGIGLPNLIVPTTPKPK